MSSTPPSAIALPTLETGLDPAGIHSRLDEASRRGKLAGYAKQGERSFTVDGAGWIFEYTVHATIEAHGEGSAIGFSMRRQGRGPLLVAAILAMTIEPGQTFTDSMIPGTWGWWPTWWWYYPLAILSVPLVWLAASKRSRLEAQQYTGEQIAKIAASVGATGREA